ncbi:MAG: DJ-1/PfpI family protein [Paenisporosarcina sp.]
MKVKKALFLIFDQYAEFEVNLAAMFLKSNGYTVETFTVENEKRPIIGEASFHTYPDLTLRDIEGAEDYDILITPGGNIFPILENERLLSLVREFHDNGKFVAGICAGTSLPSKAGILTGKQFSTSLEEKEDEHKNLHDWPFLRQQDVTVNDKIITAQGNAYVEFATAILREMGLFEEGEEEQTLDYFKNRKVIV